MQETQLALDHAVDMANVVVDMAKATTPPASRPAAGAARHDPMEIKTIERPAGKLSARQRSPSTSIRRRADAYEAPNGELMMFQKAAQAGTGSPRGLMPRRLPGA